MIYSQLLYEFQTHRELSVYLRFFSPVAYKQEDDVYFDSITVMG